MGRVISKILDRLKQGRRQDFKLGEGDIKQNFQWRRQNFGSKTLQQNLLNKNI